MMSDVACGSEYPRLPPQVPSRFLAERWWLEVKAEEEKTMVSVGLDLGKKRDHTAIVWVESPWVHPLSTVQDRSLLVRAAERLPLGVSYCEIVEIVRHVINLARARCGPHESPKLAVDATGLGKPVVDLLRAANLGCVITAVTITGGDRQTYRPGEGFALNVPKQNLISGLQVALDRGELRIASRMREAGILQRELLDVRMSGRELGHLRYGADGHGQHDDPVIALALAVWRAKMR